MKNPAAKPANPANPYKSDTLLLPMHIRAHAPFGYTHGEINFQGIKHPGVDLNDGAGAWADLGQDLRAPDDSLITFVGRGIGGWGTLMAGLLAKKIPDPATGELIWAAWRLGHPKDIHVKPGQRVKRGEVIGTCGNGNVPGMLPHAHFDLMRRDVLEQLGQDFVTRNGQAVATRVGMPWTYWDVKGRRDHFKELYIDPAPLIPELRAAGL